MFSAAEPSETKTVSVSSHLYCGDQAVVAAGQLAEVFIGVFKELQNRLGEVVASRDDAVHVVFLVLHGAKEDGVGEVHHLGNAAAGGSKQNALRFSRAVDDVFRRAEVFADQLRLMLVEGALQVAGEEAVHDVHAGRKRKLGHAARESAPGRRPAARPCRRP